MKLSVLVALGFIDPFAELAASDGYPKTFNPG